MRRKSIFELEDGQEFFEVSDDVVESLAMTWTKDDFGEDVGR